VQVLLYNLAQLMVDALYCLKEELYKQPTLYDKVSFDIYIYSYIKLCSDLIEIPWL